MDKIASLREILEQDPQNAFARYGLAMEFAGRGESQAALAEFDRLLTDHPTTRPATSCPRRHWLGPGSRLRPSSA